MRAREFTKKLLEQQLDELRMNPGALRNFAASPAARGIQAGFEAELIFSGIGSGGLEPDWSQDRRADSIDDVVDFFRNDDWDRGLTSYEANRLYSNLYDEFQSWQDQNLMDDFDDREAYDYVLNILEKDYPEDEYIEEWLESEGLEDTEQNRRAASGAWHEWLEEQTNWCIEQQNNTYDQARDQYDSDHRDDYAEYDFLRSHYPYMSDIRESFDLTWPYWEGNGVGEFDTEAAENLAKSLAAAIGARVQIGNRGYKKPGVWYIESDSSIHVDHDDDMPAEIVSPPMPLDQCLAMLDRFFSWAESHYAYANQTTGFHMGVSLPVVGGQVDYLKLALFLGDQHVLATFGRVSNSYTRSAMSKIADSIRWKQDEGGQQLADAMLLMRNGLIELAAKSLGISPTGYGKYTSINPHGGAYIEFRSAGGKDYFNDIVRLQNTLMRYAQAMYIASRPDLAREEYYKKLYKFLSTYQSSWTQIIINKFAELASGKLTKEQFKQWWATEKLQQQPANPAKNTLTKAAEPQKKLAQRIKGISPGDNTRRSYRIYSATNPDYTVAMLPDVTAQELDDYIRAKFSNPSLVKFEPVNQPNQQEPAGN